ncbi:hypothetical protein EVAR_89537_1 [Eumeta japonica]|uniref:Uncharacterized protein n=1 Tax=Eumeta variegata TaxID=151549 RepID=A0A4C1Y6T8_EUMVA|nr:hypothetical protein EVAR_89537_1 [Eumeta japonica]
MCDCVRLQLQHILRGGVWLYRVFAVMTWWQICVYQAAIWLTFYVFYEIQFPVNRFVHGSADDREHVVDAVNKVTVGSPAAHDSDGVEEEGQFKTNSSTPESQSANSRNITLLFKNENQTIKA